MYNYEKGVLSTVIRRINVKCQNEGCKEVLEVKDLRVHLKT